MVSVIGDKRTCIIQVLGNTKIRARIERGNIMEFFEVVKKRRAVRMYKSDPVNREDIPTILEAAHAAPSGRNLQSWDFWSSAATRRMLWGELRQDYRRLY
ncbi:MAG: nitroreductase family protein [Syntrophomonadaceae bacterium]|nr:nitroreductase family protein [Syntrophomonadaceae bacterium]